jgi:hypothetical protein
MLLAEREEAQEIVLRSRGVLPIRIASGDPGKATTQFLRQLLEEVRPMRKWRSDLQVMHGDALQGKWKRR